MKAAEMMETVTGDYKKKDLPDFQVGDTLKVNLKVKEGDKTRTQIFEGVCIRRRGTGVSASFTMIKETHGDIVEKIFPVHAPTIEKIVVARKRGRVRRSKLYYLRGRQGKKATKVKDRNVTTQPQAQPKG